MKIDGRKQSTFIKSIFIHNYYKDKYLAGIP